LSFAQRFAAHPSSKLLLSVLHLLHLLLSVQGIWYMVVTRTIFFLHFLLALVSAAPAAPAAICAGHMVWQRAQC
jgi:hypothetical protein